MLDKATKVTDSIKTLTLRQSVRLLVALVVLMPLAGVWLHNRAVERIENRACKYYIDALADARNDVKIVTSERNTLQRENNTLRDTIYEAKRREYVLKLENTNLYAFKRRVLVERTEALTNP